LLPHLTAACHLQSFVERCLVKDADERPSAAELLKHPFIKGAKPTTQLLELMESKRANKVRHALMHHSTLC
jgi:serine/threonine protein kinase